MKILECGGDQNSSPCQKRNVWRPLSSEPSAELSCQRQYASSQSQTSQCTTRRTETNFRRNKNGHAAAQPCIIISVGLMQFEQVVFHIPLKATKKRKKHAFFPVMESAQ